MSGYANGVTVIAREPSQQCDYCGKISELRPYGKNGACICFPCAMLDESEAERQFARRIEGRHRYYKGGES